MKFSMQKWIKLVITLLVCTTMLNLNEIGSFGQRVHAAASNWTPQNSGITADLYGAAYGQGKWLVIGDNRTLLQSTDGNNWSPKVLAYQPNAIYYSPIHDLWILAGDGGLICFSKNGTDWTQLQNISASPHFTSIAENRDTLFVAGGPIIYYLFSGENGALIPAGNASWGLDPNHSYLHAITYSTEKDRIVMVGDEGWRVYQGSDRSDSLGTNSELDQKVSYKGVTYGKQSYITVGERGSLYTSIDGNKWNTGDSSTSTNLNSIASGGGKSVAVGDNGTIISSRNDTDWSAESVDRAADLYFVAFSEGKFVAVGQNGTILVQDVSNAKLQNLTVDQVGLTPPFTSETYEYTSVVPNEVTQIEITPVAADRMASITVNEMEEENGSAIAVPLPNVGPNIISVRVTAQDGVTSLTYTLTITRAPSSNANLSSLEVSSGELSPEFSPENTEYTLDVAYDVENLVITPKVEDSSASVTVRNQNLPSGSPFTVPLSVGENEIDVKVTAQDGTTRTYTIMVNRALSSNAELSDLTIGGIELIPVFSPRHLSYTASVSNETESIAVTPTVADSEAAVKVNAMAIPNGTTHEVTLEVGDNMVVVEVTAQDGTIQTYTIIVNRALSSNAELSDLTIGGIELTPVFSPGHLSYTASVSNETESIAVTPTVANSEAAVKVNGIAVPDGTTHEVTLEVGDNMVVVEVTAQDGAIQIYTIRVTRQQVPVTEVILDRDSLRLQENGRTATLTATVLPSNATNPNVTWISSDTAVATVTEGEVTSHSPGTATITVTTEDGSFTATALVTVFKSPSPEPPSAIDPPVTDSIVIHPPAKEKGIIERLLERNKKAVTAIRIATEDKKVISEAEDVLSLLHEMVDTDQIAADDKLAAIQQTVVDVWGAILVKIEDQIVSEDQVAELTRKLLVHVLTPALASESAKDEKWLEQAAKTIEEVAQTPLAHLDRNQLQEGEWIETFTQIVQSFLDRTAAIDVKRGKIIDSLNERQFNRLSSLVNNLNEKLGSSDGRIQPKMRIILNIIEDTETQEEKKDKTESAVTLSENALKQLQKLGAYLLVQNDEHASMEFSSNLLAELNGPLEVMFAAHIDGYELGLLDHGHPLTEMGSFRVRVTLPVSYLIGKGLFNDNELVIQSNSNSENPDVVKYSTYDSTTGRITFYPSQLGHYTPVVKNLPFTDIADASWAKDSLAQLAAKNIVKGNGNGEFKPTESITRAEFIQMLMSTFDLINDQAESGFSDIHQGAWYFHAVASAEQLGIASGKSDLLFSANDTITRQEMAVLIHRLMKKLDMSLVQNGSLAAFTDQADISGYASDAVTALQQAGLMLGKANGTFGPQDLTTRAEATAMVYRLLGSVIQSIDHQF